MLNNIYKVSEPKEMIPYCETARENLDYFEKELKDRNTKYFGGANAGEQYVY